MRKAPSVTYPVGPSFLRSFLYGTALILSWIACGFWASGPQVNASARLAAGLACLLVTGCIVLALRRPVQGRLRWDGQCWRWSSGGPTERTPDSVTAEVPGRAHVRLDWQSGMLLEFVPFPDDVSRQTLGGHRRSLWLWLESRQAPAYWNALRRAAWTDAGSDPMQVSA